MTNAPFTAPGESQHYLHAIGIGDGKLIGPRAPYAGPILSPKETAWRRQLTRAVSVPRGLAPDGLDFELFHPNLTPACGAGVRPTRPAITEATDVGEYEPLPYLLPAVAVRLASHPAGADRAGRVAPLLLWLALHSPATWMLWDRAIGILSLVGLVVAATPMVVFMGSSLSDSSAEIVASVAFFAPLLRLARGQPRHSVWAVAAISGASLTLSRSLGSA